MEITYDYYRVFYYAAKCGSFSKAALVLQKGQPNITKTIGNLENQLGCRLFIRSSKGLRLTPEGEVLFRHAEVAFDNLTRAEQQIRDQRSLDGGQVSVTTTESGLYGVLLSGLTSFNRQYPNVRIRLSSSNTPQALEAVKNGLVDLAVTTMGEAAGEPFRCRKIREYRSVLCCRTGYPLGERKEIFDHPYISVNRQSYTYQFYQEYLRAQGIRREPDIEVATGAQVLPLIKAGIGIGFLGSYLAKEALAAGQIEEVPLAVPPPLRSIWLVEDQNRLLSPVAMELKRFLLSAHPEDLI